LLKRWSSLDVRDYARVLHLAGDYGIIEMEVEPQDWLAHKSLAELDLSHEGVLVLGVQRSSKYIGAPKGHTRILPNDTLILYGRSPVLADLDLRRDNREGDQAHQHRKEEQERVVHEETQVSQPAEETT
jgi:uncharacterized protein with PhoU and TrkA domain